LQIRTERLVSELITIALRKGSRTAIDDDQGGGFAASAKKRAETPPITDRV